MKLTAKKRAILIGLLALVFLGSLTGLIIRMLDYQKGGEDYAQAADLVQLPDLSALPAPPPPSAASNSSDAPSPNSGNSSPEELSSDPEDPPEVYVDPYADALQAMDFTALRAVNSQVLGWIVIPGTAVSYPLLQGTDNTYYLNHTWSGAYSGVGAIFLECTNSAGLGDFNTIVYGHRMNNGSMFGSLKEFKRLQYWSAHPYVYITTDSGTFRYEIFAAFEAGTQSSVYRLGLSSDQSRQEFIDFCLEQSVIDTGIVPQVYDRILTLSTCTGNGYANRWVVQAVLHGTPPEPEEPVIEPDPSNPAEPSGTPEPGTEPEPADTPDPSAEPEPADTPEPSAEPEPADTPEPGPDASLPPDDPDNSAQSAEPPA